MLPLRWENLILELNATETIKEIENVCLQVSYQLIRIPDEWVESRRTGHTELLETSSGRLPTEAPWEGPASCRTGHQSRALLSA